MNFSALIKSKIFSRNNSNNNYNKYNLFNDIVGYDDIKEIFRKTILSLDKQFTYYYVWPTIKCQVFIQWSLDCRNFPKV